MLQWKQFKDEYNLLLTYQIKGEELELKFGKNGG
jgi:hypothetical protein